MKRITPCLWFDSEGEEAAKFYVSIFPNSKIKHIEKYTTETPSNKPIGSVMTVTFELDGNEFMALNGGSFFKLNEAISLIIPCKDQKEMDYYYDKLSADPKSEICGWLKDKYGLSWQVVPENFDKMMSSTDEKGKARMMKALLDMGRINLAELEKAAKGKK